MFENQKDQVETLMSANPEFRSLYQRHQELDKKVQDAELGVLPIDDVTLARMKKEKLWAKDRLTHMFEHQEQAAAH
ncbi:MAG: YdcH family protein [Pseudoxanthomonas sp.]|nr:YdcH family protein [Pseudoxanthomonas sp.]